MRTDKLVRHATFVQVIDEVIASKNPQTTRDFEGYMWAVMKQSEWSDLLEISDKTLRALAKISPVVSTKTKNGRGPPIVLYRTGAKPHESSRVTALKMKRAFRKAYPGWKYNSKDFGCLCGLAGLWPSGVQVDILRSVIDDMGAFKTRVKMLDPDSQFSIRFYDFVCLPLLRKFPEVGLEMYVMRLQKAGKPFPPSIAALYPHLVPKLTQIGGKIKVFASPYQ